MVAPISGGPSERVGIRSGDKIVNVDGEVIGTDLTNQKYLIYLWRKGTEVVVGVLRVGKKSLSTLKLNAVKYLSLY